MQQDVRDHLSILRERKNILKRQQEQFDAFVVSSFVETNEASLVRPLAHVCGYLTSGEVNVLDMHPEAPRCVLLESADNPLLILLCCGEGKTKY